MHAIFFGLHDKLSTYNFVSQTRVLHLPYKSATRDGFAVPFELCFIDTNAGVGYIVGCISRPTIGENLIGVVAVMTVVAVAAAVAAAAAGGGSGDGWRQS